MTAITYFRLLLAGAAVGGFLIWPPPSRAAVNEPVAPVPEVAGMLTFDGAMSLDTLDHYRGGTEVHVANENKVDGNVFGNQASNLTTGMNMISEGSFAGANGVSTVIQNSGNNVLIQNSTIINLQVQ